MNAVIFAPAVAMIIAAMKAQDIRRLVHVSGMVSGGGIFGGIAGWMLRARFAPAARDRAEQESLVETSGLDWAIIVAPRVTRRSRITREGICDIILDTLGSPGSVGKRRITGPGCRLQASLHAWPAGRI
jgi:hypothetical protein